MTKVCYREINDKFNHWGIYRYINILLLSLAAFTAAVDLLKRNCSLLTSKADVFVVNPTDMVVTWVTMQSTIISVVEYGAEGLNKTAKGYEDVFIDGGSEKRMMYIHRVTITGLRPGKKYCE